MITLEQLLQEERLWRKHLSTQDRGSYCESPSQQYDIVARIVAGYKQVADNLLQLERYGYKLPQ